MVEVINTNKIFFFVKLKVDVHLKDQNATRTVIQQNF